VAVGVGLLLPRVAELSAVILLAEEMMILLMLDAASSLLLLLCVFVYSSEIFCLIYSYFS
jgi:hypothetical protein